MESRLNFLVDTNVWLERLLEQENASVVDDFLKLVPSYYLSVSDFSLHSIGVIMHKLHKLDVFSVFIDDLFAHGSVSCLQTSPTDNQDIIRVILDKHLDYDDAYQVVISQLFDLHIVTFDKDFKKCGIKTLTPKEAGEKFRRSKK